MREVELGKKISSSFKPLARSVKVVGRPRIPSDVVLLKLGNLRYTPQLHIRIGTDIMRQMSWKVGDRVSLVVGTVEGGLTALCIKRSIKGTHRLVGQSSTTGQMVCAWVKIGDKAIMQYAEPLLDQQLRPERRGNDLYVIQPPGKP